MMEPSARSYRPQSPDLSSYAPQSPDLSGLGSNFSKSHIRDVKNHQYHTSAGTTSLSNEGIPPSHFPHHAHAGAQPHQSNYSSAFTSNPSQAPPHLAQQQEPAYTMVPNQHYYHNDGSEYSESGPSTRSRRIQPMHPQPQQLQPQQPHQPSIQPYPYQAQPQYHNYPPHQPLQQLQVPTYATHMGYQPSPLDAQMPDVPAAPAIDPTYGVQLKTSFPVARIKRIMQNDDDIGKVAQVTPHVVSRALELFMIKLITASASQAQGGPNGKGQKRILAQHLKRVVMTDDNFDFLREIVNKVPDVPSKNKKEANSDSEDSKPAKKKGKKRKDSADDF